MRASPELGLVIAQKHRVEIERELGRRSFYWFFRMAWGRMDPAEYIDNWHVRELCDFMQRIAERKVRDGVACIPPGHLKSLLCSVAFPAWIWTREPAAKFLTTSYDEMLSTRDSVKTRRLIESDWYQERWGDQVKLVSDQNQKTFYETTAGGFRLASTVRGKATGHRADFILCDDPHNVVKGESETDRILVKLWWFEAIPSRFRDPKTGCKLVIQQRVHEQDLAGACIERGYDHIVLPARFDPDHPQRYPRDPRTKPGELLFPQVYGEEELAKLERELGPYAAAGQLQQLPAPRSGGMFQKGDFDIVDEVPEPIVRFCRGWDFAATVPEAGHDPDWTVSVKIGQLKSGRFIILDVDRFQRGPHDVEAALYATAARDGNLCMIRIPQDPGQAGKAQAANMVAKLAGYNVEAVPQSGSKVTKATPFSAQTAARNVLLLRAPWNDTFLAELCGFPNFKHDDQVDAAATAFNGLVTTKPMGGIIDFYAKQAMERVEEMAKELAQSRGISLEEARVEAAKRLGVTA